MKKIKPKKKTKSNSNDFEVIKTSKRGDFEVKVCCKTKNPKL